MIQNSGTTNLTASGQIGAAAKPIRIFAIHVVCGTAANASIKDTDSSGTLILKEIGTANTGKTVEYGPTGIYFPNGAYCSFDTNVTSVAVAYAQG